MQYAYLLAASAASLALAGAALAQKNDDADADGARACTTTASLARRACGFDAQDNFFQKLAACANSSDSGRRSACREAARDELGESRELCSAQSKARRDICGLVGEAAYDPAFDPKNFETDFHKLANPNRYFPIAIGDRWEYKSNGGETDIVEVLDQTKLIEGVTCVVVRDEVSSDGVVVEGTDDWYAQAKDGSVWYCGEEVKDFETFEGDEPVLPELVAIDGSFKAGRDDAKPGVIFLAKPARGVTYREEFSLGNAEDVSTIITTTYGYGADPELDTLVPEALARLLCRDDCIVTKAFTAVAPGVVERKYSAPGIGTFLETAPDTGEVVQLVNCNFDPRCRSLPQP
jgi:hypothetical protein